MSTWSLVDFHVKVKAITTAWSLTAHRSRARHVNDVGAVPTTVDEKCV